MRTNELSEAAMQVIKEIVAEPYEYCANNSKEHLAVTLGEIHGVVLLTDELKRSIEEKFNLGRLLNNEEE